MKKINVNTKQRNYTICLGRGILSGVAEILGSGIYIITDSGVPSLWVDLLKEQLSAICEPFIYIFPQGEANKNMETYGEILAWLADNRATRKSIIIALGGGVTGDMAGFAAATYMRGIEYINIPTTALSQIDSSVGGKTAIDHNRIKNLVGAFHQPSLVIIDPETLSTLDKREISNGLAEAVKAGLIGDGALFEIFEHDDYMDHIEEIIERSLEVKRRVVEADENESSLRKILNFGHTLGHAYESYYGGRYLHGECVAMGMMKMTENEEIKTRLGKVLQRLGLPTGPADEDLDKDAILSLVLNDKKAGASGVDIIRVREMGRALIEHADRDEIRRIIG